MVPRCYKTETDAQTINATLLNAFDRIIQILRQYLKCKGALN